jgi:hypothetical protein
MQAEFLARLPHQRSQISDGCARKRKGLTCSADRIAGIRDNDHLDLKISISMGFQRKIWRVIREFLYSDILPTRVPSVSRHLPRFPIHLHRYPSAHQRELRRIVSYLLKAINKAFRDIERDIHIASKPR